MATPLRVLIVDDSQNHAALLVHELRREGFDPSWERVDSREALIAAIERQTWDIVTSDEATPSLSSTEALALVRERAPDTPVIIVSGDPVEDPAVETPPEPAPGPRVIASMEGLRVVVEKEMREAKARGLRRAEERPRPEADETYRTLVHEIPAVTYIAGTDDLRTLAFISPQIEAISGYPAGLWLADPEMWIGAVHEDDRARVLTQLERTRRAGEPFVSEYRLLTRGGREVWVRDDARVVRHGEGHPRLLRGFMVDITEQKAAEAAIRRIAFHDSLTDLPNRAHFEDRVEAALRERRSADRPFAIVLLNLDRFKEINTTLGQGMGDRTLQEVARRLGGIVGEEDFLARIGGDEFGVLLPGAGADTAAQIASALLETIEDPFPLDEIALVVGATAGMAICPDHGASAALLMQRARSAVHTARRSGNAWAIYAHETDPFSSARLRLMGELPRAIAADQLLLHFQPRVNMRTRKTVGVEALVRWRHPDLGLLPPARFLGPAEQSGWIGPLTRWVLNQAAARCRGWLRGGCVRTISVNLSARSLDDPRFADEVAAILAASGVPPDSLIIEIKESALLSEGGPAMELLDRLARRGVRLSIDDFGTGQASLRNLGRLPLAELKIDRTFVAGLAASPEDREIVRSIVELSHRFNLLVVADGVEDAATWQALADLGCDAAQGYYLAKPMAAADLDRWLRESPWAGGAEPSRDLPLPGPPPEGAGREPRGGRGLPGPARQR